MALPGLIKVKPQLVKPLNLSLASPATRMQQLIRPDHERRSSGIPRESLLTSITNIGKSPRIIYDFGDADCYPGSGQTIFDLGSSGIDMYLGETSGVASDDPTFVGSAGGMALEHMLFDGGDTHEHPSDPATWVDDIHKSTAGVSSAVVLAKKVGDGTGYYWSTNGQFSASDRVGFSYHLETGKLRINVGDSGGLADVFTEAGDSVVPDGPHMFGWVVDDASGTGFFYRDGEYEKVNGGDDTFTVSFATHTAALPAGNHIALGASGRTSSPTAHLANGSKIYSGFLDDTAWTKAEFDLIWERVSGWLLASD